MSECHKHLLGIVKSGDHAEILLNILKSYRRCYAFEAVPVKVLIPGDNNHFSFENVKRPNHLVHEIYVASHNKIDKRTTKELIAFVTGAAAALGWQKT